MLVSQRVAILVLPFSPSSILRLCPRAQSSPNLYDNIEDYDDDEDPIFVRPHGVWRVWELDDGKLW
jgi:hypothetical protein